MSSDIAMEEYAKALKLAQKELRDLQAAGKNPHPAVLDDLLSENGTETVLSIGLVDIPVERIVGTKSAGRISSLFLNPKWLQLAKLFFA